MAAHNDHGDVDEALYGLIATAQSHHPDARAAANFLLAWWHAHACGAFDLQDLRQLGPRQGEQVAQVLDLVWHLDGGPEHLGLADEFKALIATWRAHSEVGSTGTWKAPAVVQVPVLTISEHQSIKRLLQAAAGARHGARESARFLLAWLDAKRHGGFDPRLVGGLPRNLFDDMLTVIRLIARCRCHPGATGYGEQIERLAASLPQTASQAPNGLGRIRQTAASRSGQ